MELDNRRDRHVVLCVSNNQENYRRGIVAQALALGTSTLTLLTQGAQLYSKQLFEDITGCYFIVLYISHGSDMQCKL